MDVKLKKSLAEVELSDLVRIIETQEKDKSLIEMNFDERLERILTALVQERENRLIERLIRNANFKYPMASIESLNYDARQIKKSTIKNLASMGFISNATNIIITGPTGAGKTYLACALGVEACRQKYRSFYIRMPDLLHYFEANRDSRLLVTRYRKQLCNYQLLIIDEWLNYKIAENDAKILFEILEGRAEKHPTVFVGQYPRDEWHDRLGGGTAADSIMDRIVHNAYPIPTSEANLRKLYDTKKLSKLVAEIEK